MSLSDGHKDRTPDLPGSDKKGSHLSCPQTLPGELKLGTDVDPLVDFLSASFTSSLFSSTS